MVCQSRSSDHKECSRVFAELAGRNVECAAAYFSGYVRGLQQGGRGTSQAFELAVLNVGNALLGKVLGYEGSMTPDERRKYPGVAESIAQARCDLGLRKRTI